MSTRFTLALGACIALTGAMLGAEARAQVIYFGGEGGWSNLEDQRDRFNVARAPNVKGRYDSGFAAGARVGYEWGPWRFEEEYAYRENDLDRFNVGGVNIGNARGSRNSHAIMTNVLYDINLAGFGWNIGLPVTPHIGAGIGAVNVQDRVSVPGLGRILHDDDWRFGYQAIGGFRYNITPAVALDLDYRYLATEDATFRVPAAPSVKYKSGYETHTLMASLLYRFGPPPAPPVAAPPVAPAPAPVTRRVFLVFFDWDRDTITPDGMRIVQQAAEASRAAPVQIQVTGYTDASGSAGYNQRLSERRANNVANALSRFGVPRQQMVVSGRGKNDQRVPTADGVREPQNRRVEIVFP
jgi:outer membrane protein OmpA-like peptidoglycan-associated protein